MKDIQAAISIQLKEIIADANIGPPTDSCCCIECGSWTPWKHPEAHEHENSCTAPGRYHARRDWKSRLRTICESLDKKE